MSIENECQLTFAILDKRKGYGKLPPASEEEFPLPAWYRAVHEVPLAELSIEDVCKACRQRIHLEEVMLLALKILHANPLAGELYDGELLVSLLSVPAEYWPRNQNQANTIASVLRGLLHGCLADDELQSDLERLLAKVEVKHKKCD